MENDGRNVAKSPVKKLAKKPGSQRNLNEVFVSKTSKSKDEILSDLDDRSLDQALGGVSTKAGVATTIEMNPTSNEDTLHLDSGAVTERKSVLIDPNDIDTYFEGNARTHRKLDRIDVEELIGSLGTTKINAYPIYVRPHPDKSSKFKYQLIAGYRRTTAQMFTGKKVSSYVIEASDHDATCIAALDNAARKDLGYFDIAVQINVLMKLCKMDTHTAAKNVIEEPGKPDKVGRSSAFRYTKALRIPEYIQDKITKKHSRNGTPLKEIEKLVDHLENLPEKFSKLDFENWFKSNIKEPISIQKINSKISDKLCELTGSNIKDQNFIFQSDNNKTVASISIKGDGTCSIRLTKSIDEESRDGIVDLIKDLLKDDKGLKLIEKNSP